MTLTLLLGCQQSNISSISSTNRSATSPQQALLLKQNFYNLSQSKMQILLGNPVVIKKNKDTIWQYVSDMCTLDIVWSGDLINIIAYAIAIDTKLTSMDTTTCAKYIFDHKPNKEKTSIIDSDARSSN